MYLNATKSVYVRSYLINLIYFTCVHACVRTYGVHTYGNQLLLIVIVRMYKHTVYICTFMVINVTEALSVADSDDDCCVSYTVTVVDVRSCTRRPPRLLDQQHISEDPHMPMAPKSQDHFQYPGM